MNDAGFPEIAAPNGKTLAVIGAYSTRTEAYERALVVSSMELPHWILRQGEEFALCLRPGDVPAAAKEIERFEAEREQGAVPRPPPSPAVRHSSVSLYVCAMLLSCFFFAQGAPEWWAAHGAAENRAILHGEWWRTLTALTLHADLEHLGSNLGAGLVCAAYLLPIFGAGWTWLLVVIAGGLANGLNAWGHRGEDYASIGASTAVFAELGMLAAAQCVQMALALRRVRLRDFLVPVGGALAFLGVMGTGDFQTDYTGHLCGLLLGLPLGAVATGARLGEKTPAWLQILLAWLAPALLAVAWRYALRG